MILFKKNIMIFVVILNFVTDMKYLCAFYFLCFTTCNQIGIISLFLRLKANFIDFLEGTIPNWVKLVYFACGILS